jgi:hypothetical protein
VIKIVLFLIIVSLPVLASHPQFLLDSTHLGFLRNKVAGNTADWQTLKKACDAALSATVRWPNPVGDTSGEMVPGSGTNNAYPIIPDYAGGGFVDAVFELGACYQAILPTDSTKASQYAKKARYIMQAITDPPVWLTDGSRTYAVVVGPNKTWGKAGQRATYWVNDTGTGIKAGDWITVTGARGCTTANGSFSVAAYTSGFVTLQSPPVLNANCANRNFNILNDAAYAFRNYPVALSLLYDWFFNEWTAAERTTMIDTMNRWALDEEKRQGQHTHPDSNYFAGLLSGWTSIYVATDGENPRSADLLAEINYRVTGPSKLRDYRNRWLSGGGSGEGWNAYGSNTMRALVTSLYAMYIHGADWRSSASLDPLNDVVRAYLNYITPKKTAMDEMEYVSRSAGFDEPEYVYLTNAVMYRYVAARMSNPDAAKFANWYDNVYAALNAWAAAGKTPKWLGAYNSSKPDDAFTFLFYDPAALKDFAALPLSYRGFAGNYAVARSDWSENAVYMTFWASPEVGNAGNGKTQFHSGALTIQHGDTHFLVYGLGESARNYARISSACHNDLHNERGTYKNKKNSVFFAERPGGSRVQGLGSTAITPPGQSSTVTSHPLRIDRAESAPGYEYYRAVNLATAYPGSVIDSKTHATAWTREVLFLRPKVVVVHDITSTLYNDDDRAMMWTFGRTPIQVSSGNGLRRFDVSDGATFKGALTTVLPANHAGAVVPHTTTSTNCPNPLDLLYRVEVKPAVLNHTADNYLAVLDAADSSAGVETVTSLAGANLDAVQIGTKNVVAFVPGSSLILPATYKFRVATGVIHTIAGLTPNMAYRITKDGYASNVISSAQGLVVFTSTGGSDTVTVSSAQ